MKFTPTKTKICELCGEEFLPQSRNQRTCSKVHTRPCPVCGKPVPFKYKSDKVKCCSKSCTNELKRRSYMKHYGVDNPAKADEVKKKMAETNLERYGVSTPFKMDSFSEKRKETSLQKYGVEHPMQSDVVKLHHKEACRERYGYDTPLEIPHVRESLLELFQDKDKLHDIASKRLKSCHHVASDGTAFDSKYELDVYEFCLRNKLDVECQIPIPYYYEQDRVTFIDFKIEGRLFECKGSHLLNGCFDHNQHMVPISVKLDLYRKYGVAIITDEVGASLFEKDNSLIGIDIELFRNPKFPYRKDRPKCFYDVKVNGNKSIHDAFYDEEIRWKMICNRMKYSSGFIDRFQILTALNVTKSYRQPSWFSKSFAKSLIQKYSTSDTIVDPFAGWGTRHDAAVELGKRYIGCDANKEVVDWHLDCGRNISVGDANTFKYDGECTVLICPPYRDTEIYSKSQDTSKTECDWLQIVMNNVPNANEYIMVCKIVDEGWERYIVDTKVNKSHFGVNNEYVLVVKNRYNK